MSALFWLTDEQMGRLQPFFPKSHGRPRVDDRRVLSGIIFVNRNGLRWRDAPREYGTIRGIVSLRTGGMNTKLHAVTDANGRPISFFMTAGQVSDYTGAAALLDGLPTKHNGCWVTGAMMPTGSAMPCRKRVSPPASPDGNPAQKLSNTTSADTKAATGSRSCSVASKTGGVSQHATTGAREPSSPPSRSPLPYCSGYESSAQHFV